MYLERALEINPYFSILQSIEARKTLQSIRETAAK